MNNNIAETIKNLGLCQRDLANNVQVSPQYLNRIIKGKITPSVALGIKIANSLGVDVKDLWILE